MRASGLLVSDDWGPAPNSDGAGNASLRSITPTQRIQSAADKIGLDRTIRPSIVNPNSPPPPIVIAVLDTGVSPHNELNSRLLDGYDVLRDTALAHSDDFREDSVSGLSSDGHGTPIAVLAAGQIHGIAPQAQVLPVKVCGKRERGAYRCLASDVFLGVCYALAVTEPNQLVLNLSLGGASRADLIQSVLSYATSARGALVAAAAGSIRRNMQIVEPDNQDLPTVRSGINASIEEIPTIPPSDRPLRRYITILDDRYQFYPASYSVPGMLSVGGLELRESGSNWRILPGSLVNSNINIFAPGGGLVSGNPRNGLSGGPLENRWGGAYTGTSFATPLVSGALALLRARCPLSSAVAITSMVLNNFVFDMGIPVGIREEPSGVIVTHPVKMLDLSRLDSVSCPP